MENLHNPPAASMNLLSGNMVLVHQAASFFNLSEIGQFVRKISSPFVLGTKIPSGEVRHSITKKRVEEYLLDRTPSKKPFFNRLTNKALDPHLSGESTLYFVSDARETGIGFVCIDIDVQKHYGAGTPEGRDSLIRWLRHSIPNGYCEISEHGKGGNFFFYVDHRETPTWNRNFVHQEFCERLKKDLSNILPHFDVENIEVKGCPMTASYSDYGVNVNMGQLCRIPRQLHTRLQEFKDATLVPASFSIPLIDIEEPTEELPLQPVIELKPRAKRIGSCGAIFEKGSKKYLKAQRMAHKLSSWCRDEVIKGERISDISDKTAMILIVQYITSKKRMRQDNFLPMSLVEGIWTNLFEQGVISKAYNHMRAAYIRDQMTSIGWISWIDDTYFFDSTGHIKGKACDWEGSQEFLEAMEDTQSGEEPTGEEKKKYAVGEDSKPVRPRIVMPPIEWTRRVKEAQMLKLSQSEEILSIAA